MKPIRNIILSFLLATGVIQGQSTAMAAPAQDDGNQLKTPPASSVFLPPAPKQDAPVLRRPEPEAKQERLRRNEIRKVLIAQARETYGNLSAQGATAYGEQLR